MQKYKEKRTFRKALLFTSVLFVLIIFVAPILIAQINYQKNIVVAQYFNAFDENGYIQNQAETKDFRYGLTGSDTSGCGWIAAYNALTCLKNNGYYNDKIILENVIGIFDSFGTLGFGFFGTNPLVLKWFIQSKGFNVKLISNPQHFKENAESSLVNIMLYIDDKLKYAHYQLMEYIDYEEEFLFYNPKFQKSLGQFLQGDPNDTKYLLAIYAK